MLEHYPTQVKVVSKEFPLGMHQNARPAAIAALAAADQGKYWEYHDKLLDNYSRLTGQLYLQIAEELGLNMDSFKKSLTDPRHQRAIEKDMSDGARAGVTGTPTIFINGVKPTGQRSFEGFKSIIDAELAKQKKKKG